MIISVIYFVTIVLNVIVGLVIFLKSSFKILVDRAFFYYVISVILWVAAWSGIYFFAFQTLDFTYLKWAIKLAFAISVFIPIFLFRFLYFFPAEIKNKRFGFLFKYIAYGFNIFSLLIFYLSLFTSHIFVEPVIKNGIYVEDKFGSLYFLYVLFFLLYLGCLAVLGIYKIFQTRGVDKIKVSIATYSCWLSIFLAVMTNVILPIFDIYMFQFESVAFSLIFILPTFYAIIKYRFLNIKLTITNTAKKILAFILASGVGILIHILIQSNYQSETALLVTSFTIFYVAYIAFEKFFNTHLFHKIFSITNTEYFQRVVEEIKDNMIVHRTTAELEVSLKKELCEKLKIQDLRVILLDENEQIRKKSPQLIKHFKEHTDILVTKELESLSTQKNQNFAYLKELRTLGEICLPLFEHSHKELVGFFILGEKQFNDAYSVEEIQAIQSLNKHLSLALMSILYNLELHTQVIRLKEVVDSTVDVTQHELRTPASVVSFALEALKENNVSPEIKKEMIEGAYLASKKLTKIMEKIFNVQALEKGLKLNFTNLNVYSFLEELKAAFRFPLMRKNIKIIIELDIPKNTFIQADREKLWQVFVNLLDNAQKFTPKGGKILLQAQKQKTEIIFKVIDNGEGVPKDKQNLIFERFGTNHHNKGIALGLYICKKIIELHQGKIWYQDTKNGGASFCISLNFKTN